MAERLEDGTEILCPLCEEETTVVQRNKKQRPYFLCRQFMAPVNLNSPISESERFLRQFLPDENERESDDEQNETTLGEIMDET